MGLYGIDFYRFGVEIEIIAEPRKDRFEREHHHHDDKSYKDACNKYYPILAMAMREFGLNAQAEGRYERYKSRCNVKRWTIMRDTSLEKQLPKSPASQSSM